MNTTAEELFERLQEIRELAQQPLPDDDEASKSYDALFATSLHEVLVLTCHAGVRDTHQAFGNLFSQVDYLCKRHSIALADRRAIQRMRRHSNHPVRLSGDERIADIHALSILMCAVFSMLGRVEAAPAGWGSARTAEPTLRPSIRCIVESWDEQFIVATDGEQALRISYGDSPYLGDVLSEGMQLNLLFPSGSSLKESVGDDGILVVENPLVVVEPDFLIDISAIARCFGGYGRHPLLHLLHRIHNAKCQSFNDALLVIDRIAEQIINQSGRFILIGGDTSSDFGVFKLFLNALDNYKRNQHIKQIVIMLCI